MSDISMTDNWRNNQFVHQTNNVNTTPINFLYQKFYSINCIKTNNSYSYPRLTKDSLINRDI